MALRLAAPTHQPQLFAVFIIFHEAYEACAQAQEPMLGKIKLAWWRERVEEIVAGTQPRPHPALLALGSKFEHYADILQILDEFERLLDGWQAKTFAEIEEFIRKTFGVLFAICGKITGAKNAADIGFAYGNLYLLRKLKANQTIFTGSAAAAEIALENFERNLKITPATSAFAIIIKHYNSKRWKLLLTLFIKAKTAL